MKILFSTDQIYLHGGIEKVMAEKANYFAQLPGVEVFILTTEQNGKAPCYLLDDAVQLLDLGVNYDRSQSYFSKANLGRIWKHYRRQKSMLGNVQPDVIISPNFNFDHYWLPFIKGKAKLIKERHSSRFRDEELRRGAGILGKLKWKMNDYTDGRYTHIVVLNNDEKKYVKSSNAVVIPNPVGMSEMHCALTEKQVMAAGRIAPVKAFDELIHIWALLPEELKDWQLHFYGDDYLDTRAQLETLIQHYGLQDQVHFKGSVPDLRKTMRSYSIYGMTSVTECFPMVLLESLSVGLPVVSYDCPHGPQNILVHGGDGVLVPGRDRAAFAGALARLMTNESLRKEMGNAAKENVQRFSVEEVMNAWKKLLNL